MFTNNFRNTLNDDGSPFNINQIVATTEEVIS